ncbi:hypothetical protein ACOSQ4_025620 [Xanthoceras sorbifolium]
MSCYRLSEGLAWDKILCFLSHVVQRCPTPKSRQTWDRNNLSRPVPCTKRTHKEHMDYIFYVIYADLLVLDDKSRLLYFKIIIMINSSKRNLCDKLLVITSWR